MSKNAFKRAVGHLYKERKVDLHDGKIRKLNEETGEWEDWIDCPQWLNFDQR